MYSMCINLMAQIFHGVLHEGTLILLEPESVPSQTAEYLLKVFQMLFV